jgi:hypothetical protein
MGHKIIIVLLILFTNSLLSQQELKIGLKCGTNFSGFHKNTSATTTLIDFHLGGIIDYRFNKTFGLKVELIYNRKGGI